MLIDGCAADTDPEEQEAADRTRGSSCTAHGGDGPFSGVGSLGVVWCPLLETSFHPRSSPPSKDPEEPERNLQTSDPDTLTQLFTTLLTGSQLLQKEKNHEVVFSAKII